MKLKLRHMLVALAGVAASSAALAQSDRNVYFALFGGLTGGGEKLATVRFSDGSSESVRAGGLIHVAAGVLAYPHRDFSVQSTVGYHVDDVNASNGSLRFSRYPIELLGHYAGVESWRFGGGLRYVTSPGVKVDFPGASYDVKFKNTVGYVIEAGYGQRQWWVNLRYTMEKYKLDSVNGNTVVVNDKANGNSIGINAVIAF